MVSADGSATYALLSYSGGEEKVQPLFPGSVSWRCRTGELETHVIGGPAVDYDMEDQRKSDLLTAKPYSPATHPDHPSARLWHRCGCLTATSSSVLPA